MKTFIKATEIWEPNAEKTTLRLVNGHYGEFRAFEDLSQSMTFAYDEGLPGKAWAAKHPLMLTEFKDSCFKRTEMAEAVGITAAIAMPIFAGEFLHAVVVFLCGDEQAHAGAIEIWAKEPERRREMGLVQGYYGTMEAFEWVSRSVKIMRGHGLPGRCWETKMPYIMQDLGESATFLRARQAAKEQITTGIALPAWMIEEDGYVMTFLSAKGTPIARRFEIWIPDETGEALIFRDGHCDAGTNLIEQYALKRYSKQETLLGDVWKRGKPVLSDSYTPQEGDIRFDTLLAIPILQNGFCSAVVVFYN